MQFDWDEPVHLGDAVSAAAALFAFVAVLVAMVQLVRTRKDLIAERRADFELTHLAEIAEALHRHFSRQPSDRIAARVRILPGEVELPILRAWVEADDSSAPAVMRLYNADTNTQASNVGDWIRERGAQEIAGAVDRILSARKTEPRRSFVAMGRRVGGAVKRIWQTTPPWML